jgi:hypothetical protein
MAWKMWRERLTYIIERLTYTMMSVFVAWHTLAIVVAPAPDSNVTQSLRVLLQPYLTLLNLDHKWGFYSPNIGDDDFLRYVIEDNAGERHTFNPAAELSWFHPNYFWVRFWHYWIIDYPQIYADYAAARFCQEHASLHPVAITLLNVQEEPFTPADLLRGKRRTDPEFYTIKKIKRVKCPDQ